MINYTEKSDKAAINLPKDRVSVIQNKVHRFLEFTTIVVKDYSKALINTRADVVHNWES